MIKKIYLKLILIFIFIFLAGNAVSYFVVSHSAEKDVMRELSIIMTEAVSTAGDEYKRGSASAETIERLYSSGLISVKFYNNETELGKTYLLSEEDFLKVKSGPTVLIVQNLRKHKLGQLISIMNVGERYVVAIPQPKGLLFNIRRLIMQVNILSLAIGSILMLIASGFIVKPVRMLSAATEKIARGEFDIRIEKKTQ